MSYTTVFAIDPGKGFSEIEELRNSWLSAPLVWDAISKRYNGGKSMLGAGDDFWALYTKTLD